MRPEAEVDAVAESVLLDVHRRMGGEGGGEITFDSWTPRSVRLRRKRRFTALAVDGAPRLVAKTSLDGDDAKIAREWDRLATLSLPPVVRHPRGIQRIPGGFVMTYAPSEDLPDALVRLGPDGFRPVLARAVELLAAMHLHGAPAATDPARGWEAARRYVAEPACETPRLRAAIEGAHVGPTHGDVAPWNVRHDARDGGISLIDWEDFQPLGIAAIDVINLLLTLSVVVFPEHPEHGWGWLYGRVLESDHWYASLVREQLVRYAALTGQPARGVVDLIPFFCQWLITRISNEGRDPAPLYYATFRARYVSAPPRWVEAL